MKKRVTLVVLWRAQGEQVLTFDTKREAEQHRDMLESTANHMIVKMEVVE